jgi:hypothetical protein
MITIKKCGSALDEDLKPKMKVRGSIFTLATYDT